MQCVCVLYKFLPTWSDVLYPTGEYKILIQKISALPKIYIYISRVFWRSLCAYIFTVECARTFVANARTHLYLCAHHNKCTDKYNNTSICIEPCHTKPSLTLKWPWMCGGNDPVLFTKNAHSHRPGRAKTRGRYWVFFSLDFREIYNLNFLYENAVNAAISHFYIRLHIYAHA